jgi:Flp pilus assembly protein TadB
MAVAGALFELVRHVRGAVSWRTGAGAALALWQPLPAVAALGAATAWRRRARLRTERVRREAAEEDVPMLTDLVLLGVRAGLTVPAAFAAAAPHLHPGLATEVRLILRRARLEGMEPVLAAASGTGRRLYAVVAAAVATGAPLANALEALGMEQRHAEQQRMAARARRLPVLLMLPTALLILPGFVLLTVAPALLGAVERLRI